MNCNFSKKYSLKDYSHARQKRPFFIICCVFLIENDSVNRITSKSYLTLRLLATLENAPKRNIEQQNASTISRVNES